MIAESVCLLVDFAVSVETASYDWEFLGGCYPDNESVNYVAAKPGTEYTFDKIPIEVREYKKSWAEALKSSFSLSSVFFFLSVLCLLGAVVVALVVAY